MAVHLFDGLDLELPDGQLICLSGLSLTADNRDDQILEVLDAVTNITDNIGILISHSEFKGIAKQVTKALAKRLDD